MEGLLEAAWEALEMAVALYSIPGDAEGDGGAGVDGRDAEARANAPAPVAAAARTLGLAEAHERLGDASLQNEQPERALQEYGAARALLQQLRDGGELSADDRRLADIEW